VVSGRSPHPWRFAFAFCAIAVGLGLVPFAPAAATTDAAVTGSGSSEAAAAVDQWSADVQPRFPVAYSGSGSSQGKDDYANLASDFAVTDVPYLGIDPETAAEDTDRGRVYGAAPVLADAVAFPYRLEVDGKLVRNLRLSPLTLADIFTLRITNWDSPLISHDNNGRKLPSLPIVPVVHSEGSGSSYWFTSYLVAEQRAIWRAFNGASNASQYWPRQGAEVALDGSSSIGDYLAQKANNGAIAMDEPNTALDNDLPVAAVENPAGYFTTPPAYDVELSLTKASVNTNPSSPHYAWPNLKPLYADKDPRSYPLSYFGDLYVPTSPSDPRMSTAKRQSLADFLDRAECQGQREAGVLGYGLLPPKLVTIAFAQMSALKAADPGVDVSKDTIAACANPTFPKGHPDVDLIPKATPYPPDCATAGAGPCAAQRTDATALELTVSKRSVPQHHRTAFHGLLMYRPSHTRIIATVRLERRHHGHWLVLAKRTTSAYGRVVFHLKPTATASYRLAYLGPSARPAVSAVIKVSVRH